MEAGAYVLERREHTIDTLVFGSECYRLRSVEKEILSERLVLLGEAPRVPRNQAAPSDVTKPQHQRDHTLETNASFTTRGTTRLEAGKVVSHCLGVDLGLPHLLEEDDVMDTLTVRKDLLALDEDIIGVEQLGVHRIGHGVEGASAGWELVHWRWVSINSYIVV